MAPSSAKRIFTLGHGTSSTDELAGVLTDAGVEVLVDVRRFPGSRKHPEMARDALGEWLPRAGIGYRWEEDLGGRRRIPAGEPEPDIWWKVEAFRAYAAYTRTPAFAAGLGRLLDLAAGEAAAIMCSETVWWRCHRRLISDVLVLRHGVEVVHLMPGGKRSAHGPSEGARMTDDGLVWDRAA
ncbi:DUF488 family protein [Arthrobacter sp. Marseille-P9274]|uniref:DUF488 domain-containing protein n=1 Tax=Arthrobacter sp. Marseille-P9274 TaxID=2866572 RepID=UPI0021C9D975|nr:DUF488 domain-containing protein [Arthrobacter sp. Marseille-P9274]